MAFSNFSHLDSSSGSRLALTAPCCDQRYCRSRYNTFGSLKSGKIDCWCLNLNNFTTIVQLRFTWKDNLFDFYMFYLVSLYIKNCWSTFIWINRCWIEATDKSSLHFITFLKKQIYIRNDKYKSQPRSKEIPSCYKDCRENRHGWQVSSCVSSPWQQSDLLAKSLVLWVFIHLHTRARACVSQNMDMQILVWTRSTDWADPSLHHWVLRCWTSSAPAMFLGPSSGPGWGHWFRVPREEPQMKVSFPFFIFPAFSVVNEMLLLDQQGSGSGGWFLCGAMWNLWKTKRTSDVELSHEDRSRFMVGLAGIPVWTGSLNWYQNHLCSASKDQVCFKTCPELVSRCLSDPEGVSLAGLNSGASLSVTSSPEFP